jgi:FKBP-type peptidyl-prolyl cis-trans isomerase FkpA
MKYLFLPLVLLILSLSVRASDKDSTKAIELPDSVRAISLLADIRIETIHSKNPYYAGIKAQHVGLALHSSGNSRWISFSFRPTRVVAYGLDVTEVKHESLEWKYNWEIKETYKLMIAVARDSAGNFSLYSGYFWIAKENKWKLIGTCRIEGDTNTIRNPAYFSRGGKFGAGSIENLWCQRTNGSWKNLEGKTTPNPVVNLLSHVDSLRQFSTDTRIIQDSIAAGKTDATGNVEGVYYKILKEGDGAQVALTDTVTVNYKLNILKDGSLVEASLEPATFPLNRLIRGWQLGVPLIKVGGKIKLVIPSAHGYSIRTRSAKIPPNSILVFEVEVLQAKPKL